MARYLDVHPIDPQPRRIAAAVEILRGGGVLAYPTDSGYALGCQLGSITGVQRLREIRGLDERHHLTRRVVCFDDIAMHI